MIVVDGVGVSVDSLELARLIWWIRSNVRKMQGIRLDVMA